MHLSPAEGLDRKAIATGRVVNFRLETALS
jgi:hypothetical protein